LVKDNEPQSNIIVVDDQPANLKLMEDMLRQEGYAVRSFPCGRLALAAAAQQPPDLILLDINMPEMDGFEVCKRLKADKQLAAISVIFLSALNEAEDKLRGFRAGSVDFITKPFQFEEVHARVQTHLQLQRARQVERDLLENTLKGAVKALVELVHMTGPALSARSESIGSMVVHLASKIGVDEPWQYELAAMLCLIGCVALPAESFNRAYSGEAVAAEDEQMFHAHPEIGNRLLSNIPRLENVAEMIRRQRLTSGEPISTDEAELGARMLRVAVELDRRVLRGIGFKTALGQLRASPEGFPEDILNALEEYSPPRATFELKRLKVHELQASMIVEDDVLTQDGNFIVVQKGISLNFTIIERLRNFAKTRGIRQPIPVRVICHGGAL
jgi:putative two-component system response regulator